METELRSLTASSAAPDFVVRTVDALIVSPFRQLDHTELVFDHNLTRENLGKYLKKSCGQPNTPGNNRQHPSTPGLTTQ
jgi:hypothetical protein